MISDQLVLLLSKTHWTTEVDDAIRTAVGAEYLLVGHKKDAARDAKDVNITIGTNTYRQFYYSETLDRTEIIPVRELK